MAIRLFASDLDGTLIDPGRARLTRSQRTALDRATEGVTTAYVTGRHLSLAEEGIRRAVLPLPAHLSCDVGTSLYHRSGEEWRLDEAYREHVRGSFTAGLARQLRTRLGSMEGLRPQEVERQSDLKLSYYWPRERGTEAIRLAVAGELARLGVEASIILSEDPAAGRGLLDVLPPGASKASVVSYLRRRLGLSREEVAFAGDSGNDIEALVSGVHGILVGNAPDDVRERVRAAAGPAAEPRVYYARRAHADGVIEGLERLRD